MPFGNIMERALREPDHERTDMVAKAPDTLATIGLKHGRQVLMTAQDISIMVQMFEFENVSGDHTESANAPIFNPWENIRHDIALTCDVRARNRQNSLDAVYARG